MRSFILNKLVRDKVFLNMQKLGQQIVYRQLAKSELLPALKAKLLEEAGELDISDEKAPEELADLMEVIEAVGLELGHTFDQLRRLQLERRDKRGGFEQKIFIERLDLQDNDPWADYYAAEPDRFKEVK